MDLHASFLALNLLRDVHMPSPTQFKGARAEMLAEQYLVAHGYVIVARNYRKGKSEIDRIAWDRDILAIIEVRARKSIHYGTPEESVDYRKRAQIRNGTLGFLEELDRPIPAVRYDLICVSGESDTIRLYKGAFSDNRPYP